MDRPLLRLRRLQAGSQVYEGEILTSFRCRSFGDYYWTVLQIDGPIERKIVLLLGGALATSGSYSAQVFSEGEWIDLTEMEFDDGKEPE